MDNRKSNKITQQKLRYYFSILLLVFSTILFPIGVYSVRIQGLYLVMLVLYSGVRAFRGQLVTDLKTIKKQNKLYKVLYLVFCLACLLSSFCFIIQTAVCKGAVPEIINGSYYLVSHADITKEISKQQFYTYSALRAGVILAMCWFLNTFLLGFDLNYSKT